MSRSNHHCFLSEISIYSIDMMDNANLNSLIGRVSRAAALLLAGLLGAGIAAAQSLNWDGQTGVFITPLAYTAASPASGFGRPIVAYHFLNAGRVLGNFHTISVTEGVGRTGGIRVHARSAPARQHGGAQPAVGLGLQSGACKSQRGEGKRRKAGLAARYLRGLCGAHPGS